MPRKARTQSGAPASAPVAPVGVPYGEGERALESQRRAPVPAGPPPVPGDTGRGGAVGGGGATDRFAEAIAAATNGINPPPSMMEMPTQRPNESITTGMMGSESPVPAGPITNDALYELRAIAQMTGYPEFLELVARAEREL